MKPKENAKGISYAALSTALSFVLVYLGQALQLFDMSAIVICGLVTACLSYVFGTGTALSEALACTVLLALFLPDKTGAVLYFAAGGIYPVIKPYAERCRLKFLIKLAFFSVTIALYIGACMLFLPDEFGILMFVAGAVLGYACFFLYDILISRLLARYGFFVMRFFKK